MSSSKYHLCHLNIGPARGPLTDPVMAGFVAKLDEINNLAYTSPGFVWHLKIDIHNPEDLAMYGEPGLLFNFSVWESVDALYNYVYKSAHAMMIKSRQEWFGEMEGPHYVLWWAPAGTLPLLEEAKKRLAYLRAHGPTVDAFTFKHPFSPPADPHESSSGKSEVLNKAAIFMNPSS
jgi:hypothetical protein